MEIQRRKMEKMNISNPTTGDLDNLIALPLPMKAGATTTGGHNAGLQKQTKAASVAESAEEVSSGGQSEQKALSTQESVKPPQNQKAGPRVERKGEKGGEF